MKKAQCLQCQALVSVKADRLRTHLSKCVIKQVKLEKNWQSCNETANSACKFCINREDILKLQHATNKTTKPANTRKKCKTMHFVAGMSWMCTSDDRRKGDEILAFHSFPRDVMLTKKWIIAIHRIMVLFI